MPDNNAAVPDDLLALSKQLEQWRNSHPARTRLPEAFWTAAVDMAQRHGLHRTTKLLRMDYTRLKKRLPDTAAPAGTVPASFLEWVTPPASTAAECVVEWESSRGRMRLAMKGVTPDWAGLLRAWRES